MATNENAYAYASIIKQEKLEDGSLLVYGKATDDALDIDQQICDAAWLNKAMPEWFKTGGNIREQHSSIAAGVAKELDSKEDGHYITAHIVDPTSVKKIEAGVLKGFSIGIRGPRIVRDNKAANGRIIDGTIVEISVVDRPANPNAKLMLAKSDGTEMVEVEQELIEQELPVTEEAVVETPAVEETPVADVTEEVAAVEEVVPAVEEDEEKKEEETVEETVDADAEKMTAIYEKAKSLAGDVTKFDKALFENARAALAGLIAVEAKEMGEGHDERFSLSMLVSAVHNLFAWFEGEEAEGEVAADIELMETEGSEKAPVITLPRIGIDGEEIVEEDTEEDSVEETDKSVISDEQIDAILEKAVKSAKESVSSEINAYKDAINELESKLATALTKAVAGGPKRATTKASSDGTVNEFIVRAIEMRTKAASTSDRELAQGYRELADDFETKAKSLTNN
jgi:hypothetical protein